MPDRFPESLIPEVIFEDTHLIVVSKPAGLLSQGEETGGPNLVDWLRERFGRNYVGLVHRLDRNTSGIMLVAKRTKAAERLTRALQEGKIFRSYLAWAEGELREPVRWHHFLWKDEAKNRVLVVAPTHPKAKEAVLSAKPLARGHWGGRPLTLLELVLETGRSHQIRVQAAKEKLPLLGDRKYGARGDFPRPALHSFRLAFEHPMSQERLEFEAPLPADLARISQEPY
ncbi:MAG: RluA family pseudouridine synthase [Oligoflexia bacterium]|nr:RluA family pseudouridine synthase [Oligoflexia bacterium]